MLLISSPRFAEHTPPPGHPERPERAGVFDAIAAEWQKRGGQTRHPPPATRNDLLLVHTRAHVDAIEATAGRAVMLDPDTFTSPESEEIARLAAGAAIDAARHAFTTGEPAFALVRPPGHHAEPGRAMGFCLYNNIAVAAAVLRKEGASRVAIVDIDVHHGNGTQAAFYSDPTVLYASSHQFPYYPGTGAAEECGAAAGLGFTVNAPLEAGATDDDVLEAYDRLILPAVDRFRPDAILVSAGFDAHARDPLAGLRMTTEGYAQLATRLQDAAVRLCGRRIALVTEGGYHLDALGECLGAVVNVIQ